VNPRRAVAFPRTLRPTVLHGAATALAVLFIGATSAACVEVRASDDVAFDGTGVAFVSARNDSGDVRISGRNSTAIDVTATVWGKGSKEPRAQERQDTVDWSAQVEGDTLVLDGVAIENRSGVDFAVLAPTVLDLDLIADSGTVRIDDIEGIHTITATNVTGSTVGDLDVYGSSSVDLDFVPYVETDTYIESGGSVTLAIPYGLDYDLTIRNDPSDSMDIAELGWDELVLGEGFVNGIRGRGHIEIDIRANGSVRIVELR